MVSNTNGAKKLPNAGRAAPITQCVTRSEAERIKEMMATAVRILAEENAALRDRIRELEDELDAIRYSGDRGLSDRR